jgi:hypothetical protein
VSALGALARLSTAAADGGYTYTRTVQGAYDASSGDFVPGAATDSTFDAVIMPYSGKTMITPIEGRHTENVIMILTAVALTTESPAFAADLVTYLAERYEVMRVEGPISLRGGTHYQVYAARLVTP